MQLTDFWLQCLTRLKNELSTQQYETWIRHLTVDESEANWIVYVPNNFMLSFVKDRFFEGILAIQSELTPDSLPLMLKVGKGQTVALPEQKKTSAAETIMPKHVQIAPRPPVTVPVQPILNVNDTDEEKIKRAESISHTHENTRLNSAYTFDTLVEGKGNRLACAAAQHIAETPGDSNYNPLFIYGSTGLGKTHLVQSIGNRVYQLNPKAKVRYIHAESYVRDIMRAFREKSFDQFKQYYHSLDLLIIDDVQFISGKDRTMEEFFYLFNYLVDTQKQVVMTCDTLPNKIDGMDDRLKSRMSWGLTVELAPPELEMRVAILQRKAEQSNVRLAHEPAFFIAQSIRSNVRELEGAFKKVVATSKFLNAEIDTELAKYALQDILATTQRQITIDQIQKIVADYYHIKVNDILGKKRTRAIARPRQIAMTLAKELTQQSLPSIGDAFGNRDHTTVLHANKTINEFKKTDPEVSQDYEALLRILRN